MDHWTLLAEDQDKQRVAHARDGFAYLLAALSPEEVATEF